MRSKPAALGERAYRACSVGSRITPEPLICEIRKERAGRCLRVRYVEFFRSRKFDLDMFERSTFKTGSGRSSSDGGGFARKVSDPLPARSDGLDNVDGGPDARFYIELGII